MAILISILSLWACLSWAQHQTTAQYLAVTVPIDSSYIIQSTNHWYPMGLMEKVQMELNRAGLPGYSKDFYRLLEINIMALSKDGGSIRLCTHPRVYIESSSGDTIGKCEDAHVLHQSLWSAYPSDSDFFSEEFVMQPFVSHDSNPLLHLFDWDTDLLFQGTFRVQGIQIIFERLNTFTVPPVFSTMNWGPSYNPPPPRWNNHHPRRRWNNHHPRRRWKGHHHPRRRWQGHHHRRRHDRHHNSRRRHHRQSHYYNYDMVYRHQINVSPSGLATFLGGVLLFNALIK